jgi:hypothetical protein
MPFCRTPPALTMSARISCYGPVNASLGILIDRGCAFQFRGGVVRC